LLVRIAGKVASVNRPYDKLELISCICMLFRPKTFKCSALHPLCPGAQGTQEFKDSYTVPSTFELPSILKYIGSVSIENIE
jgi:hypothetical protein